jgi:hypothetical protein
MRTFRPANLPIPAIAAAVVFLVHLAANPHYGFFRDELYFIICGRQPQWGYVDQPPLVPLLAALTQIFGHSLLLLRAVPALFAAGGAYVTCLLVFEFGGGAFAQVFAALVYALTPVLVSFGMKVGTDEAGLLLWPLVALLVVRIARGAPAQTWLGVGVASGLAFESKYSIVFFAAALLAGLLATPQRRVLWNPWFAAGAGLALAIALPNVLWQAHYGLPMLELLRNGQNGKNEIAGPALYAVQELFITNPLLSIAWIIGLVWLFRAPRFRFLGIAYVVLMIEMLLFHGKHYYPANVYPILIAAGAVPIESWTARWTPSRALAVVYAVLIGALFIPDVLPVLPEDTYIAYANARRDFTHTSAKNAIETEHGRDAGVLPGDWADMHGWPEMAATVAAIYDGLPPAERSVAVVFAGNYGEASAIRFFAPHVPVISEHNQYWLWGPGNFRGDVVVQVNGSCFASDHEFASRTRVATIVDRYAIDYETNIPVWICRKPKHTFAELWPTIKTYI